MILWFNKKKNKDEATGETPLEARPAEDAATANTAQDTAEKKGLFGGLFGRKDTSDAAPAPDEAPPAITETPDTSDDEVPIASPTGLQDDAEPIEQPIGVQSPDEIAEEDDSGIVSLPGDVDLEAAPALSPAHR